jgi:sulfite reductase (ferredoxin)
VGFRCLATEVPEAIERLLRRYLSDGKPEENLRKFFARYSDADLRGFLAGEFVEAVARDVPEGRVPAGLEG